MRFNIKRLAALLVLPVSMAAPTKGWAQVNNFQSTYFQNQYLANPAMAGLEKGLQVNLAYRQQFTTTPGSPRLQNLSGDYAAGDNVGLGLNVNNDQAGLISRTRVMASYAYHLPVSESGKLSFGLSLGINDTYLNNNAIVGDGGDVSADLFNRRTLYIDGDFGIAYTGKQLTVQAAVPNLKSAFKKDENQDLVTNTTKFYTAIGYKVLLNADQNNFTLEPKVAYRGLKGFDNVLDAGANFDMPEYHLSFNGIYHTNKSTTVGLGVDLKSLALLFAFTSNMGALNQYSSNTFELGLKLHLLDK